MRRGASQRPDAALAAEIIRLAHQLSMDRSALARLCLDEFGVATYSQLSDESRLLFRDLLTELLLFGDRRASRTA